MSKDIIVKAAAQMAVRVGYTKLTRSQIAEKLDIFPSSISFHCGTMGDLRCAVIQYAIDNEITAVLCQALADRHPVALKAPKEMKARAAKMLAA